MRKKTEKLHTWKMLKIRFSFAITSIVPLEESLIFLLFLRFSFWDLFCKEISNSTFSIIFSCKKWGNWKLQWWKSGKVPMNSWIHEKKLGNFLLLEVKLKSLHFSLTQFTFTIIIKSGKLTSNREIAFFCDSDNILYSQENDCTGKIVK